MISGLMVSAGFLYRAGADTPLSFQKILLVSVKFVSAVFWRRKWLRQFYGRLEKMRSFCRKTHVHKIPRFRGGVLGGGGSADFTFMGARIFLIIGR